MRFLDSVNVLREGLDYHMSRHNLLTSNLANVDTPNFSPLELKRKPPGESNFAKVLQVTMQATNPLHFGSKPEPPKAPDWDVSVDPYARPGLDGNGVNIEREAIKIASNGMRYDVVTNLTAGRLSSLAWAVSDGK